jgi:hypothetical protein
MGRRLFDGKDEKIVIQKLEQAWARDLSDKSASAYADISAAALCDYLKKHPKLSERRSRLKEHPVLAATETVIRAIKIDPEMAFKYLERKRPDEFAPRSKIENTNLNLNQNLDDLNEKEIDRRIRETAKALIDDKD